MLTTAFTAMFGLAKPVALAPMGGAAGAALAAAVSKRGGLGLLGAGRADDPSWLDRELDELTSATDAAWGVGFQAWASAQLVERAVAHGPDAVMFSFGDPEPLLAPVRTSSARLPR